MENLYNIKITSDIKFQRTLAKHEPKKELDHTKVRDKISGNNSYNNVKCTSDDLSKYSQLKKKGLNDLNLYKKLYKHRSSKKNILGKFDCYCEKKIFDKFDHIHEVKEQLGHDKRSFNKKLNKIFDIPLILFALVPFIGFIIPLLKNEKLEIIKGCFSDCTKDSHLNKTSPLDPKPHKDEYPVLSISGSTWETICIVDTVFLCLSTFIVSCVVLYIFIKVIMYKKLKAGRDKMSLKEYYHFTKSLI
ncbi:hypothetical protein PVNG_06337 [Plasmodium vivax North Korean]|uniref:Variable surface protein Vir35 n=1 Tax=Plasmodium vivax North Korean TaxID=1035514 RepID=A0A0J9W6X0_PLAVI|nr:hypothetical protein PVNG_06337 [Plasmodium vivax North Korean]